MSSVMRHSLITVVVLVLASLLIFGVFVWSGVYNVAADAPHTRPMHVILETMRERSIAVRADELAPPADLTDDARITQGAGNYSAMCTGCHLAPGMAETEMSRGLYPAPPNLSKETIDAASAFWVIKHGIKASGMPAWGESMDDEYIWNMAAFLQRLPELSAEQYEAMVASSGGHDHGGGETQPHDDPPGAHDDKPTAGESKPHAHPPGTPADHHDTTTSAKPTPDPAAETVEHRHADGTVESHPVQPEPTDPPASPDPDAATQADDGHQHQH